MLFPCIDLHLSSFTPYHFEIGQAFWITLVDGTSGVMSKSKMSIGNPIVVHALGIYDSIVSLC